jgi:hypothetical protein
MEQLVKFITEKTGLSEEQAMSAAQAVLEFAKDKVPAPLQGMLDGILGGDNNQAGGNEGGGLGDMLGGLGKMFGK